MNTIALHALAGLFVVGTVIFVLEETLVSFGQP